jgi:hypothetical protein
LVLTYSFDPLFFEQLVLPNLKAGRSSDILVLGDEHQIESSVEALSGPLWSLGRQYLLSGAKTGGAFHPKLMLRLGPKDGIIMLGSGNITSSGWGGNLELATAWALGPGHVDNAGWLTGFLKNVLSWCSGDIEEGAVQRMLDLPWLSLIHTNPDELPSVVHSSGSQALGPVIAKRWVGRRFDEVKILTGSTDESGAFLRWAHTTFGVTRATVVLTPPSASFDPAQLKNLPLELRLIVAPTDRPLHAKFYWFDGPEASAALMGSANCSAAAWLLPPNQGGNIETLVVYDSTTDLNFASALDLFESPSQSVIDVFGHRPNRPDQMQQSDSPAYRLTSLSWDKSTGELVAEIQPAPVSGVLVEALVDSLEIEMTLASVTGSIWRCELSPSIVSQTIFVKVRLRMGVQFWFTPTKWVNNLSDLQHARQLSRLIEPLKMLERQGSSKEQRVMLKEMKDIVSTLLNDTKSFQDTSFVSNRHKVLRNSQKATGPVNLDDLLFHLKELPDSVPHFSSSSLSGISLNGITRMLFKSGSEVGFAPDSTFAFDEEISEEPLLEDSGYRESEGAPLNNLDAEPDGGPIEAQFKKKLEDQIEVFLIELSSPRFAANCTATQMIQAVSLPLTVALLGQRSGWVSRELAEKWAVRVFSILFWQVRGTGLLHAVEKRYAENDQSLKFAEVAGDGTLWLVLIATLGQVQWDSDGGYIEKALAMREIFTARQLLECSHLDSITSLLGKSRVENAYESVTKIAPMATQLLDEVEACVLPVWEAEKNVQTSRSLTPNSGDILWRHSVGWALCLAQTGTSLDQALEVRFRGRNTRVMPGFYVNLTELATQRRELAKLLQQLRDVM